MIAYKRIFLLILLTVSLFFTLYQCFLIFMPLFQIDNERRYVHLVDQYELLKMQRLVLEEKYAVATLKAKLTHTENMLPSSYSQTILAKKSTHEPIALSLAETKTFEQLEAYVSSNKPQRTQPLTSDEKSILQSPANHFTLQVLGVRDPSELTKFISEHQLPDAHTIHTFYLNKDWYVLVSGSYANHTEALKAIETLPTEIKQLKPWIRPLSSLQKAIELYRNEENMNS